MLPILNPTIVKRPSFPIIEHAAEDIFDGFALNRLSAAAVQ